jgi:hypothetical protein
MLRDLDCVQEGRVYVSNNPCFPLQVFRVTKLDEPATRFGQPNRIVEYERYAFRATGEWYLVERERKWLWNADDTDFGQPVPEHLYEELPHGAGA